MRRSAVLICVLLSAALALAACGGGGGGSKASSAAVGSSPGAGSSSALATSAKPTTTKPPIPTKPVHVSTFQSDGQTYGIGMAIIAQFDVAPTTSREFTKVVKVTVNGQPYDGAWFFQNSNNRLYKVEAIFHGQNYWPPHAKIHVDMPIKGLSAGTGLAFSDNLTLDVNTGAANVSTVVGEQMSVVSDSKLVKQMPVSLGAADTPTYSGTKVVMEKKNPQHMVSAPGEPYYALDVPWSVRVTSSGEFIHSASWNTGNIGSRNTSHGCTNLRVADAKWYYGFAQVGDVVQYPAAGKDNMPSWDGFGWWNIRWATFKAGGLLVNHGTGD